jgi:hypothetical protein
VNYFWLAVGFQSIQRTAFWFPDLANIAEYSSHVKLLQRRKRIQ